MCGIAGFIADRDPEELADRVGIMVQALVRRGSDGTGLEVWDGAVLGHRRLAIIDLSEAGHQPMVSDDREIGVVFNGCIYNFLELRSELESAGCRFRSHCDTEVLLHGYRVWGIDRLAARLQGMFAFGIWDARGRTLSLVRDRLGVKPLAFSQSGGGIAFASTPGALHQAGFTKGLNAQGFLETLEFGWPTDNLSIYEGVQKLPPATILTWHEGKSRVRRYWHPDNIPTRPVKFADAVDETEGLLLDAVRLRLIADVPIGALLSGGIDSSLVCWALTKLNSNVRAFTVGTPGEKSDETAAAVETAQRLGIEHQVVELSRNSHPDSIEDLTEAFSEPFACTSALGMLGVSAAVRPYAKVLLTGDGGDDFFLGYPHHRHMAFAQRIANTLPTGAASVWNRLRPAADSVGVLRRPKHFFDYATGGLGAVTRAHDGLPFFEANGLLGPRLEGHTIESRRIPLSIRSAKQLVQDVVQYDLNTVFRGEYLPKVDGTTLFCGIEARSPFLDYRMAELALSLPSPVRLRAGRLKAVLRELTRRHLGEEIAYRPKLGFTVPVERWLATRWRSSLAELGSDSLLAQQGWIAGERLKQVVTTSVGTGGVPKQIWHLLVLERWLAKQARVGRSESMVSAGVPVT